MEKTDDEAPDHMFRIPSDGLEGVADHIAGTPEHMDREVQMAKGGHKDDTGKLPIHLIAPEFIFSLAAILQFGANKYAERNWEKGISQSRLFAAAMRHLWSWWGGKGPTCVNFAFETDDEETKFSHLWHAGFCIMAMVTFEERGRDDLDDRPSS